MKTTGKLRKYIYGITFFFLVLTGFGQMPVYKRYYISDIPGLDWLSQFYITHVMHYIASFVLIALAVYIFISFILCCGQRPLQAASSCYFTQLFLVTRV